MTPLFWTRGTANERNYKELLLFWIEHKSYLLAMLKSRWGISWTASLGTKDNVEEERYDVCLHRTCEKGNYNSMIKQRRNSTGHYGSGG